MRRWIRAERAGEDEEKGPTGSNQAQEKSSISDWQTLITLCFQTMSKEKDIILHVV